MVEFLERYRTGNCHPAAHRICVDQRWDCYGCRLVLAGVLSRIRKAAAVILPVISIFQTVPGIVFIGMLMFRFGMTRLTVILALSVYAVFPILKNAYQGLVEVDPDMIEVAKGCGMNGQQIFFPGGASAGYAGSVFRNSYVSDLYGKLGDSGSHDRPGRSGRIYLSRN